MNFDFFDEPSEVIEYLKAKKPEIHFDYDEIMHSAHHKAFTVAKVTKLDLLSDIQESLAYAQKKGLGFKEWKKTIKPTLIKKGWYKDVTVTNPKTGEIKNIYVGNARLKNIYNTNMRVAYAQGRYQAQMSIDSPYLRYVSILSENTRASHAALHGLILPKNDPWWDTNYPPNDWNCKCKAQTISKTQLKRYGWSVGAAPKNIATKDWAYHVGKTENIDNVLKQKVQKLKNKRVSYEFYQNAKKELGNLELKRNLYIWQHSLNNAIEELIIKENIKSPIKVFQLGFISPFIAKKSKEILNVELKNNFILGDKHGVLHVSPQRKGEYGQDLRVEELRQIVKVLADDNTPISIDTKNKNIIYWFDDKEDPKKINKIVVDLNYNLKKFGVTNYMVTVGKVDIGDEKGGKYIKIR